MKTGPPVLLPLLRSPAQARLLAAVLLDPDTERPVTELAQLARTSLPTATREVRRAEGASIVTSRLLGGTRLVRGHTATPLYRPLAELLLLTFGPETVLRELLSTVHGIEEAYLFGSWAARYHGEPGQRPNDVDLLVLGEPDRAELDVVIAAAEQELRQGVDVTVRPLNAWRERTDPFLRFVRDRPLVRLLPREEGTWPGLGARQTSTG